MIVGASAFVLNSFLVKNLIKNLKNRKHLKSFEDLSPPQTLQGLTLAMPLRNEAKNLRSFLPLLANQHSQPERFLFLDDQSTDETQSILTQFAAERPTQARILTGTEPPENFRGKAWALKQLLAHVETPYLVFIDADVRLSHPRALFSIFEEARPIKQGRYSFASVYPRPKAARDASLLVNQLFVHLYYLNRSKAVGCGQVMLIDTEKLREYKFLDKISSSTDNGLKLAQLFEKKEKCVAYFDGGAFFQSEYYPTLLSALKGFSRTSIEADNSPLIAIGVSILIFWCFILPFVFLPFVILNPWWLAALFTILWGQYRLMQELDLSPLFVATTPVAATLSCGVHLWSALKKELNLKEEWRGRVLR